ncbi:MAG TPA: PD-(D/E)XK nuclease family protein [Steroidobacteraceae bacterium]|nr:PD-(D/E)XK nuclease family protein [Steroidobacteraceae bacterium]
MIRLEESISAAVEAGGTLVVPSRQRAHAARLAYAAAQLARGRHVWASPQILAVEGWQVREIERAAAAGQSLPRLLSPAEEWLLWRQCTAVATESLELLDRPGLADGLRQASALAADFGLDVASFAKAPGLESPLLCEVQGAVDARCLSLGAARMHSLTASLSGACRARTTVFAGFTKLPPRLVSLGAVQPVSARSLATPRVVRAADETEELERIALWCQDLLSGPAQARLLVILPGAPGSRERLATLIRQTVDARAWLDSGAARPADEPIGNLAVIEGGSGLARIPVVAHALDLLSWLAGTPGQLNALSEWLRSPYWSTPEEGARARIDLWLRERSLTRVDLRNWRAIVVSAPAELVRPVQEIASKLDLAAHALREGQASPRDWSERFRAALEAAGWPGSRVRGSGEQQTVVRFHELLDELGQLALASRSMSLQDAVHWLTELAARANYRPADEDALVTIAPALLDPVVSYEGIWVAGLHADVLPRPLQPDAFIPLALQTLSGIPQASSAGRLQEAHALMNAWRAATNHLVLSVPRRSGDLELLPSPMLSAWGQGTQPMGTDRVDRAGDMAATDRAAVWLAARLHRPNRLECIDDPGLAWPAGQLLPSGTRSLELQNLCAFRAYAELRLGSKPMETPEPGVALDVRGQLLHAALEKLWQSLRDSRALAAHSESSLGELIERCVAEAAQRVLAPRYGGAASRGRERLLAREHRRTVRLIKGLCALERERKPFRVQATEAEATLTLAGAPMRLRIDRLDELEDGGHAILDYKSGRRQPGDWYSERPSHPQLLAYLAAHRNTAVATATVNVTAREIRFDGIADSAGRLPRVKGVQATGMAARDAWSLRTLEWLTKLENLTRDFLAGRAVLDPKPGACDFCHAIGICRISERALERLSELNELSLPPSDG